ncbi:MAG: HAD family phosphatase [Thermoanaerobaculia bacterium]
MPHKCWFIFDLGNVVVKVAYERVLAAICSRSDVQRDELVRLMEEPGGYHDLERGAVSFREFHQHLVEVAGYRDDIHELYRIWSDFFDGTIEGIEELLERVRAEYRVAFLSNSNPVHAEVIPRQFAILFRKEDRLFFSHVYECAKPDPAIFNRVLHELQADPDEVVFVDDLAENVSAAKNLGITAYQFHNTLDLTAELERDGLLKPTAR